jgi:HSP20 family molecular chaperone IbpA
MIAPKALRTDLVPVDRKGLIDWPLGQHMTTGPFPVPSMMQNELQNFLDDPHVPQLFKNVLPTGQILVDIAERKKEYILSADMPGITKEDIAVSIGKTKAHSLRISASRKFEVNLQISPLSHTIVSVKDELLRCYLYRSNTNRALMFIVRGFTVESSVPSNYPAMSTKKRSHACL